jgi:hypothetical protein
MFRTFDPSVPRNPMTRARHLATLTVLASAFFSGCSGMGTSMTKVGRLTHNKGYEIASELPMVQQAALDVLKARGYDVSVKADPESGPERAGQIVIAQRIVKYSATTGDKQMDTRDLIDVYLYKKWQLSDNNGVPNLTLVDIVGGNYLRKTAGGEEVETPLTADFIALLRDDIERSVNAAKNVKAVVK